MPGTLIGVAGESEIIIQKDGVYKIELNSSEGGNGSDAGSQPASSFTCPATKGKGQNGAKGSTVYIVMDLKENSKLKFSSISGTNGSAAGYYNYNDGSGTMANGSPISQGYCRHYTGAGGKGGNGILLEVDGVEVASLAGGKGGNGGTIVGASGGAGGAGGTKVLGAFVRDGFYVNTEKCTNYKFVSNDYTGTISATVELAPEVVPTEAESLNGIKKSIDNLTDVVKDKDVGGAAGATSASVANVVANRDFSIYIPMEIDATGSFTVDNITCINNNSSDGYIQLTGLITTEGQREYLFSHTIVVINAVQEPDSSNISSVFN